MLSGDIESNPGPGTTNDCLSILHCNIRSIRNKFDYIKDSFLDNDIICFTETHLDNSVTTEYILLDCKFDEPYRKDRNNHGGGILIYLNNNVVSERLPALEIYCSESIWIQIQAGSEKILIGVFYSPKTADREFFHNFNMNIEAAYNISKNLILLGDLNEDLFNPNFHNLKNVLYINSLKNTIDKPTRLGALLDPILIPHDFKFIESDIMDTNSDITDHKATYITIPFLYDVNPSYERQVWLYDRGNYELLNNKLNNHDWGELLIGDINTACIKFTNSFLSYVKQCIPQKTVLVRPDDKPWFDATLRKFCRIRDRLKKKQSIVVENVMLKNTNQQEIK
jgi:exonuclease III